MAEAPEESSDPSSRDRQHGSISEGPLWQEMEIFLTHLRAGDVHSKSLQPGRK